MASGEEARRPSVSSSSIGLEALFPAGESEQLCGDGDPELMELRERLDGWLSQYEPVLLWLQRLLVWERPLHSLVAACTLNTMFWLLSSTSLRPIFLLSVSLMGLVLLERWKHKLPHVTVQHPETTIIDRETLTVRPRLLSVPELSHHVAESLLTCSLYVQEMLQYKRQNHGKFCGMTCSGCLVLALVGHYIPGIMISYIILLSVLLWPLVVYHELIQKMYTGLEPILMKLDYSMKGETQHRKHDKWKVKSEAADEGDEPRAETESESEEELSCFAPTVDVKTTALAMAITDSELSDEEASILESGGFSVSRATTPQLTDFSEEQTVRFLSSCDPAELEQHRGHSDPEESFLRDLSEFPSVDEPPSMDQTLLHFPTPPPSHGAPTEPQSPASLLLQHLASPLHFVNTHFNGHGRPPGGGDQTAPQGPGRSLEALSEEIVSTAISTVVQNTLSALLRSPEVHEGPSIAEFLPADPLPIAQDQPSAAGGGLEDAATETTADDTLVPFEEEDFELLDQSELQQMDEGLALGPDEQGVGVASSTDTPPFSQHQQES